MSASLSLMGWIAIGIAASLVSMVLPNRRGTVGVAINVAVCVLGSLAGGYLGLAVGAYHAVTHPSGLFYATVGALVASAVYHAIFLARHRATTT